jgi:hypothetical protein
MWRECDIQAVPARPRPVLAAAHPELQLAVSDDGGDSDSDSDSDDALPPHEVDPLARGLHMVPALDAVYLM